MSLLAVVHNTLYISAYLSGQLKHIFYVDVASDLYHVFTTCEL